MRQGQGSLHSLPVLPAPSPGDTLSMTAVSGTLVYGTVPFLSVPGRGRCVRPWGKPSCTSYGSLVTQGPVTESTGSTGSPGAAAGGSSIPEDRQPAATFHPGQRQLREFTQGLLRELLLGAPSPKQWQLLDVFLEVGEEGRGRCGSWRRAGFAEAEPEARFC